MSSLTDAVMVRMDPTSRDGKFQVEYKGFWGRGATVKEAMEALRTKLAEANVPLPPNPTGSPSVYITPTTAPHPRERTLAQYLPLAALGENREDAENNLRVLCELTGVEYPTNVYDVHDSLKAWMN